MLFKTYGQAVLTLHERHLRVLIAERPPGKASRPIARAMSAVLGALPPPLRRTVTFDNGTEFARHHELHALGMETFFCDTHLVAVSDARFAELVQAYNNTPRKCLGYLTPAEVFQNQVLHFKCESPLQLPLE